MNRDVGWGGVGWGRCGVTWESDSRMSFGVWRVWEGCRGRGGTWVDYYLKVAGPKSVVF